MSIQIRKATDTDFPSILSLIKELAEFEKGEVTNTVEQMYREKEYFHCYVAESDDREIIGIAPDSSRYPSTAGHVQSGGNLRGPSRKAKYS